MNVFEHHICVVQLSNALIIKVFQTEGMIGPQFSKPAAGSCTKANRLSNLNYNAGLKFKQWLLTRN